MPKGQLINELYYKEQKFLDNLKNDYEGKNFKLFTKNVLLKLKNKLEKKNIPKLNDNIESSPPEVISTILQDKTSDKIPKKVKVKVAKPKVKPKAAVKTNNTTVQKTDL
jgi:hypothetical protein